MFGMKSVFRVRKKYPLQAFGKLPLYSDYLSVLIHGESNRWRRWLLDHFSGDGMRIPQGQWPFVFYPFPGSNLVVGLVEDSSDGIREFPFSLFVICPPHGQEGWFPWESLVQTWNALSAFRSRLDHTGDVDACYRILRSESLRIQVKKNDKSFFSMSRFKALENNGYLRLDQAGSQPVMLAAPNQSSRCLHMLAQGACPTKALLANWNRLTLESA